MANYVTRGRLTDECYTPPHIFDAMELRFDTDAASPVDRTWCHVPADNFITERSLDDDVVWSGLVWLNPPFGARNSKGLWVDKMIRHGLGILLLPDRTSAPWWPHAAKHSGKFLQCYKKIKFIQPGGKTADSPNDGTYLFAFGPSAGLALHRAQKNGLGIVCEYAGGRE
jgi:hypothetical protein